MRTVIAGGAVSTVDDADTVYADGYVVVEDGIIAAVGSGSTDTPADRYVDARGCLVTPGFVNTHHHLYQWATRGYATDSDLFHWLVTLYPVWSGLDEDIVGAAAAAGLARLARTGCTTVADHHYVFPRDGGDVFAALVDAGSRVGVRLEAIRGSMDRGRKEGGLPPDSLVETLSGALEGTAAAIDRYHDASFGSRVRVAVGPCSPFSVSTDLMRESAALARSQDVRLHTHLAETLAEEKQCRAEYGCSPVEYADRIGFLGSDVWLAHGVHLDSEAVALCGRTGTGVAHCPTSNARLASGIAPVAALLAAGAPVGLGVDGAASNEDGGLIVELRQAVWLARLAGNMPDALTAAAALRLATTGGAACLGRSAEIGSVQPGKNADLAVWDLSTMDHAGIADPVTALVFGPIPPLALLLVGGEVVVERDELRTADETALATDLARAARRLADR